MRLCLLEVFDTFSVGRRMAKRTRPPCGWNTYFSILPPWIFPMEKTYLHANTMGLPRIFRLDQTSVQHDEQLVEMRGERLIHKWT